MASGRWASGVRLRAQLLVSAHASARRAIRVSRRVVVYFVMWVQFQSVSRARTVGRNANISPAPRIRQPVAAGATRTRAPPTILDKLAKLSSLLRRGPATPVDPFGRGF